MNIHKSYYETLYSRPVVALSGYCAKYDLPDSLYAYLAYGGTTGSAKDALAEGMLALATEKGLLQPGQTVIECSSGSFAVALAVACAHSRHPLMLCMPATVPLERQQMLTKFGAQIVGEKAGAPVFALPGEKPEAIAKKAVAHAKDYGNDIVILDTAGRLHVDGDLMAELQRIKENVQVDETLLVIDAMAGQDAVNVAKSFSESTGLDGVILTKLDGDTRGGSALSVRAVTGKPIKFAGVGEKLDDLEVFHPSRMASRILGMGDVLTLIEKAQDTADQKKAEETAKRLMQNKFDMNDMLDQFEQVKKMGGAAAMMSMFPGAGRISDDELDKSEKELGRMKAIIQSMTKGERAKPSTIDPKRKRRIAAGSGTRVEDVNRLLRQYEQMQKMMKQFKKNPKGFGRGMKGLGGMFR